MVGRLVAGIACAGALLLSGAPASAQPSRAQADGGTGTYFSQGRSTYFVLTNTGTAAWQSFYVVAPPGTVFVAGANTAEITARCVAGQPDGLPNEIECGPLSANVAPAHGQMTFAATLAAPIACGATFQLAVSSTGALPFTQAGAVTQSGACAASPSRAHATARAGTPKVGRVLSATAPTWSSAPTLVAYRWQRCARDRLRADPECEPLDAAAHDPRRRPQRPARRHGDDRRRHRRQHLGEAAVRAPSRRRAPGVSGLCVKEQTSSPPNIHMVLHTSRAGDRVFPQIGSQSE